MRYQDRFEGTKAEFIAFINLVSKELFTGKFRVEGDKVSIPANAQLNYKVKYDEDETAGSLTIKVAWDK